LDFAIFEAGFSWDRFRASQTRPSRSGRIRYRFVGTLGGEIVVVAIVSPLGSEALSLVSRRTAKTKESAVYDKSR
jgi:uncharacterized DUF497 family protein